MQSSPSGRQAATSSRSSSFASAPASLRALGVGQGLGELLEAVEPGGVQPADHRAAGVGQADALHPPVLGVLVALDEAAPDEVIDRPAGGGQRDEHELGAPPSASARGRVLEVVQQLDLGQRQLERPDRLEQVGVAVLVQEHDERVEVGRQVGTDGVAAQAPLAAR